MAMISSSTNAINEVFEDDFSDFDDPFLDKERLQDRRDDKPTLSPRTTKRKADVEQDAFGLGLDEEVKILKKRKPIAKLDEARLLSEPGLPKIRTLVRTKKVGKMLRLKGKGHEFNDAAKLLNYFQLWLDNLYPRAKFADALQMVEKAGHTKRMQVTRCEWIDEGKPGFKLADNELSNQDPDLFAQSDNIVSRQSPGTTTSNTRTAHQDSLFLPGTEEYMEDRIYGDPDDDELEALLMQENHAVTAPNQQIPAKSAVESDSEGEDDLDALLAEQDQNRPQNSEANSNVKKVDLESIALEEWEEELDDEEVLLAERKTAPLHDASGEPTLNLTEASPQDLSTVNADTRSVHEITLLRQDARVPTSENDSMSASLPDQDHEGSNTSSHINLALPYWGTNPTSAEPKASMPSNDIMGTGLDSAKDDIELDEDILSSSPVESGQ